MKIDNNIMINKIIDSDKNIYLIMDLCLFNLEEYINMRKEKLSIEEIKKILLDLNKSLKIMIKKKWFMEILNFQIFNFFKSNKSIII